VEPSSLLAVLLPLMTVSMPTSADAELVAPSAPETVTFGRVTEVSSTRSRVEQFHANRLRLSEDLSIGGVFSLFEESKEQNYTFNVRLSF